MIKAMFFDVDGTLVSFRTHRATAAMADALQQLHRRGVKLFISTGRHPRMLQYLRDLFPFDGWVTMSGQFCYCGDQVIHRNPTLRMITATMDDLVPMGQQLLEALQKVCDGSYRVTLTEDFGQVGGGSVPTQMIRSSVVDVEPTRISLDLLETRLREHDPLPVIARISKDRLLLDVRTIESRHFDYVAQSILDCCSK